MTTQAPKFPPRYWLAVCPSENVSEIVSGGDDFEAPLMLPPCVNTDLPQWIRYISLVEAEQLARKMSVKTMERMRDYVDARCLLDFDRDLEEIRGQRGE